MDMRRRGEPVATHGNPMAASESLLQNYRVLASAASTNRLKKSLF